jgi:hypothetical protein
MSQPTSDTDRPQPGGDSTLEDRMDLDPAAIEWLDDDDNDDE